MRPALQEISVQQVVDYVGMDFDSGIISSGAVRRGFDIADPGGSSPNHYDLAAKRAGCEFVLDDVGHGVMRIGIGRAVIVDQNLANIIRFDSNSRAELNVDDADLSVVEDEIITNAEGGTDGH